jgi:hypothetical protein
MECPLTDKRVQLSESVFSSWLVHERGLFVFVREGLGIIEQDARLCCLGLVEWSLIFLLLVVEIGLTVEWGDLRGILGFQGIWLLGFRDVVT